MCLLKNKAFSVHQFPLLLNDPVILLLLLHTLQVPQCDPQVSVWFWLFVTLVFLHRHSHECFLLHYHSGF